MSILSICDNGDILRVLQIVKIIITIIKIAVPILLIVSGMIGYMNAVKDNDELAKYSRAFVAKIIAAVLVFFIPTFVRIIVDAIGADNTYATCIEDATDEKISAAYRVTAEKRIDIAKKSLSRADYNAALQAAMKVKGQDDKAQIDAELKDLLNYIEIREDIYKVAASFTREAYLKLKEKVEAITDTEMKERLLAEMKEAIGNKGSLAQYIQDPNDPLYRNLKNFSGTTLKQVLERNGSSEEKLELQIQEAVRGVGVGTRQAPAAAAFTLMETLANYGYRINYDWGGKWYHIGVDGNWGKRITPAYCDSHPNPDRCKTNLIWKGFDCSGFVNWALIQGFQDESVKTQATTIGNSIFLGGKTTAVCDIGDVVVNDDHITLVVGHDDANKRYLIAESTGGGVKLSYYPYNNPSYYCRHVQYSN